VVPEKKEKRKKKEEIRHISGKTHLSLFPAWQTHGGTVKSSETGSYLLVTQPV
jgi:hypothetical protein